MFVNYKYEDIIDLISDIDSIPMHQPILVELKDTVNIIIFTVGKKMIKVSEFMTMILFWVSSYFQNFLC